MDAQPRRELIELTSDIVASYVAKNPVGPTDLPGLIQNVHDALKRAQNGAAEPIRDELRPAVPVKRSVTPDHIVCLEDGQKFKSLKRHLRTRYNMSPEEYRRGSHADALQRSSARAGPPIVGDLRCSRLVCPRVQRHRVGPDCARGDSGRQIDRTRAICSMPRCRLRSRNDSKPRTGEVSGDFPVALNRSSLA